MLSSDQAGAAPSQKAPVWPSSAESAGRFRKKPWDGTSNGMPVCSEAGVGAPVRWFVCQTIGSSVTPFSLSSQPPERSISVRRRRIVAVSASVILMASTTSPGSRVRNEGGRYSSKPSRSTQAEARIAQAARLASSSVITTGSSSTSSFRVSYRSWISCACWAAAW